MERSKKVAFVTLGCKLNFSETSSISREFQENGYEVVAFSANADIYVINTCSVTEHADKKCRNIIRKLHRQNEDAIIAVTGCYAQLKPEEIANIEGVDLVFGANSKGDLFGVVSKYQSDKGQQIFSCAVNKIETIFPAYSSGDRTRSFLKVQDGCDYFCTYCTIPMARGRSRNMPVALLVEEAKKIASTGIKEVVLTGVNTGDFGHTTGEKFLDLLKALNEVEGIERYRISSIEPNLLDEEIAEWISSGTKFLPHFHIPLQSGSDKVLKGMKRRYDTKLFEERIAMLRSKIDNLFIGIDVIVGFPGETEEDFEDTCKFLERVKPAFLHIFPYSKRSGTIAAKMEGQVSEQEKNRRVEVLKGLSDKLHEEFVESNRGREEEVLFESREKGGMMFGYTRNYILVKQPYEKEKIGKIIKVTLS